MYLQNNEREKKYFNEESLDALKIKKTVHRGITRYINI